MCVHRINIWDVRATASRRLSARLKLTSLFSSRRDLVQGARPPDSIVYTKKDDHL